MKIKKNRQPVSQIEEFSFFSAWCGAQVGQHPPDGRRLEARRSRSRIQHGEDEWRHYTQYKDIQYNDSQHNNTQHNNVKKWHIHSYVKMLSVLLCWAPLCRLSLSIFWMSLCWVSLNWMLLVWVSWRHPNSLTQSVTHINFGLHWPRNSNIRVKRSLHLTSLCKSLES